MTYGELRVGHILQDEARVWCVLKKNSALFLLTDRFYELEGGSEVTQTIHFLPVELL